MNLGELELYYDFSTGEGTSTFTPNTEVTGEAANINSIGVTGFFGKSIYDKRTNIPSLGGANTGPAAILGLAVYSTGRYVINGPVFQVRTNQVLNELYATYNGAKIGQNVTALDVDDGLINPGAGAGAHAFLFENDGGSPVANGFGWSQTFEHAVADASDAEWTTVDAVDGIARYHFYQVNSGWTTRTWAPAYEVDGNSAALTRTTTADATPPNAVCLAMAYKLPLTTANQVPTGIFIKGNLMADAIIDSHTLGADASWVAGGGGIDIGHCFDFDTVRGLAAGDSAAHIDRDSTGRIYAAYGSGVDVDVARLQAGLTAAANDDEIIPSIASAAPPCGLDVVDDFSKIYIATGVAGTGLVNIFSIPADGADGTAIGTLDVGTEQTFAGTAYITDIVVDAARRMLYVAYAVGVADDGLVVGFALNADGTLVDNTHDSMSAAGLFDAASGGGKLAVNATTGSVYVSSGDTAATNGVNRLVATTLGADGVYDISAATQTYTTVAVSSDGVVYAGVESAVPADGILPYAIGTSPDTAGSNDCGIFSAAAVPAGDQGVVRFESNATYSTGTWLFGDQVDAATAPNLLFAGTDPSGVATNAPTDFVVWGTGAVTGTTKLLCADDFGGAAGMNISWMSM